MLQRMEQTMPEAASCCWHEFVCPALLSSATCLEHHLRLLASATVWCPCVRDWLYAMLLSEHRSMGTCTCCLPSPCCLHLAQGGAFTHTHARTHTHTPTHPPDF